jgi:cytochrome c oxidase subunit 2
MPIVVRVVSDADYTKWVDGKKKDMAAKADDPNKTYTLDELKTRGEKVYTANCAVCHQPNGKGGGPFPALDGSKIANGPLADHVSIVLHGKAAMPPWASALNDVEIASVITYERNNWGNHTNDVLQPTQVKEARGGKMPEGGGAKTAAAAPAGKVATQQVTAAQDRSAS